MSTQRSLTHVLARQWAFYTLVLFGGFFVVCVLLLYILEDSFINRRLREVASSLTSLDGLAKTPVALPEHLVRYAAHDVPSEIAQTLFNTKAYGIKEFRLSNHRYVHAMKYRANDGTEWFLVYDVSDQMRVNMTLYHGLPYVLLAALLLAIAAYFLAYRLASRTGRQAQSLLTALGLNTDAASIRKLAHAQRIREFSQLAMRSADAVEQQQATLERERQTLEFMAHELRTPLQSLRTNIALLNQDKENEQAWRRLQRASARLVRASYSVLWLSEQADRNSHATSHIEQILEGLREEFSPLLHTTKQTLSISREPHHALDLAINTSADVEPVQWAMPAEIIETVLANVLLNAIQHGQSGDINIRYGMNALTITNPSAPRAQTTAKDDITTANFGMGLEITRRLLNRLGWTISHQQKDDRYRVEISNVTACSSEQLPPST